jgi:hypothetical protein
VETTVTGPKRRCTSASAALRRAGRQDVLVEWRLDAATRAPDCTGCGCQKLIIGKMGVKEEVLFRDWASAGLTVMKRDKTIKAAAAIRMIHLG